MTRLDYINQNYPVRKSDSEKHAFRRYVLESLKEKGIEARVETTKNGNHKNVIIGDPTTAKAVFTAHYDTPARSIFPNIMIPKNPLVFYSYQFVPVIFLLVISLTLSYLFGMVLLNNEGAYMASFLILYYGIFFLGMRIFTNKYNYNDNTSGVATVLSIVDSISEDDLKNVAFILFDNEEKGKLGSAAYYKDHKEAMKDKFLLNFDCVGNGNNVIFIAQKGAADSKEYKLLSEVFDTCAGFELDFCTSKEGNSNSDHKNFPMGVACVACKKTKGGLLYTPYIHTHKDVVADNGNIDFLTKNTCIFLQKLQ